MSIPMIDSGSRVANAPQPASLKQVEIQRGDSIKSIADAHGTTPQALLAANPQVLNPDVIYPGQMLNLPAEAPKADEPGGNNVDVTGKDTTKTGTKDNGTSSTSQGNVKVTENGATAGGKQSDTTTRTDANGTTTTSGTSANGSVAVDPDKGTVTVSGGTGFTEGVKNSKGYGVSFGIDANATVVAGQNTKDGVTTYTASSDVSVSLKAGVDAKQAGLEIGHTEGIKASYEVSMPEQVAKATNLATVNPFDASSMPTGTIIKMDGSSYTTNEFKATFKNIAAQTKVTNEEGSSLLVEKTGAETVRVTVGPTEAIKAYNGVGVDFGVASAMLGRDDSLTNATLKTAEFDLSTTEGKAAYSDFVANGNMPTANGPGVADVKTIEKLDYSSQSKIDAKIGPVEFGIDGAKNTGNSVVTTYPDGTIERTVDLQYSGNVPMSLSQKFDASGNEIVGERRYAYTMKADANSAQLINAAQTGDVANAKTGPVRDGDTVTITYTQAEMSELMGDAQKALEASQGMNSELRILTQDYDGNPVSAFDFALGLARNIGGSDYGSAERLFEISSGADGDLSGSGFVDLPGTVTVTR